MNQQHLNNIANDLARISDAIKIEAAKVSPDWRILQVLGPEPDVMRIDILLYDANTISPEAMDSLIKEVYPKYTNFDDMFSALKQRCQVSRVLMSYSRPWEPNK